MKRVRTRIKTNQECFQEYFIWTKLHVHPLNMTIEESLELHLTLFDVNMTLENISLLGALGIQWLYCLK